MPILIITPDMTADTWLGAIVCALGNQTCNGITPALMPKPTSARMKIPVAIAGLIEPLAARNKANIANRTNVAVCVATR